MDGAFSSGVCSRAGAAGLEPAWHTLGLGGGVGSGGDGIWFDRRRDGLDMGRGNGPGAGQDLRVALGIAARDGSAEGAGGGADGCGGDQEIE